MAIIVLVAAVAAFAVHARPAAAVDCGDFPWGHNFQTTNWFFGDSLNLRSGPHTSCSIRGTISNSHAVYFYCWDYGDTVTRTKNGVTTVSNRWTYLFDLYQERSGWASNLYLPDGGNGDGGAIVYCG